VSSERDSEHHLKTNACSLRFAEVSRKSIWRQPIPNTVLSCHETLHSLRYIALPRHYKDFNYLIKKVLTILPDEPI